MREIDPLHSGRLAGALVVVLPTNQCAAADALGTVRLTMALRAARQHRDHGSGLFHQKEIDAKRDKMHRAITSLAKEAGESVFVDDEEAALAVDALTA